MEIKEKLKNLEEQNNEKIKIQEQTNERIRDVDNTKSHY